MDKHTAIQMIATAIDEDIQAIQRQLNQKKELLVSLGILCDHPTLESYRGNRIGKCEFCLTEFRSRELVDSLLGDPLKD